MIRTVSTSPLLAIGLLVATLLPTSSAAQCNYVLTLSSPQMQCGTYQAHLTWSWDVTPPGNTDFTVQYRVTGTQFWFNAGTTNGLSFDLYTLNETTSYEFRIDALTGGVICPHIISNVTSGTTFTNGTMPSGVTAVVLTGNQVRIHWDAPNPSLNTSVKIFKYGTTPTLVTTRPYSDQNYTYPEACPTTRYQVQNISANNCDGPTVTVYTKPLTPTLTAPVNGANPTPPVTMTWSGTLCPWIPEYLLQISATPGFESPLEFHPTTNSYVWNSPWPGNHYWRVKAVNNTQSSDFTLANNFTTPPFSSSKPFPGLAFGMPAWGDYDNDGDLDLLLTGDTGTSTTFGPFTGLYRNTGGTFTPVEPLL